MPVAAESHRLTTSVPVWRYRASLLHKSGRTEPVCYTTPISLRTRERERERSPARQSDVTPLVEEARIRWPGSYQHRAAHRTAAALASSMTRTGAAPGRTSHLDSIPRPLFHSGFNFACTFASLTRRFRRCTQRPGEGLSLSSSKTSAGTHLPEMQKKQLSGRPLLTSATP